MDRLGLGIDVLRDANPKMIVAAISSQGETGPERDVSSFGSTLEATSGMAYLAGAVDGDPVLTGRDLNYPDQVVALFAAGMITAALVSRRKTGSGIHLDISQRELTSFLLGERFLADTRVAPREGNADACTSLQLIAPTLDGCWIALTAANGDARPCEETIRRTLAEMTEQEALAWLEANGFACSSVLDSRAIRHAPWFPHSHAFATLPDGQLTKGFPFQFRDEPMRVSRATPTLGQDTAAVLSELLQLTNSDLAALSSAGVIGDRPLS